MTKSQKSKLQQQQEEDKKDQIVEDNSSQKADCCDGANEKKDVKASDTTTTTATTRKEALPTSGNVAAQNQIHPFVFWAQSQTHISLRIDLIQAEKLTATVVDGGSKLEFSAYGTGAHGLKEYYFILDFFSEVESELECNTIERYVLILINKPKSKQVNWPRLTKQSAKLPWLRIDFDRWAGSESDDSEVDSDDEAFKRDEHSYELLKQQLKDSKQKEENITATTSSKKQQQNLNWNQISKSNFDIFNPFNKRTTSHKNHTQRDNSGGGNMKYDYRKDASSVQEGSGAKNTARQALDFKKTYLFLYNIVMFTLFLKVWLVLVVKGLGSGPAIDDDVVVSAAFIVKLLTYTQLLETLHPILGLVPGGPFMPFLQAIGRLIVNEFLTDSRIRLDAAPYAHYLFVVWTSIEIFRYSYYALRVFNVNIYPLTWCRYTLFIPLYPMGGLFESMVIFSTIKIYEKTGEYSVSVPNAANISFSLPIFLRIYTFCLLGPSIYYLMRYMWKQRTKQLKEKVA